MPIEVILGAVALAASVPLLWMSLASQRASASSGAGVPDMHQIVLQRSALNRVLRPLVGGLAERVRALTPRGWVKNLEKHAALAGVPEHHVERYLAAKLTAIGVAVAAVPFVTGAADQSRALMMGIGLVVGTFMAPDGILRAKASKRQDELQNELPDTLDQIMISVEAGLGFEGAMGRVARTGNGPMAEEIQRTMYEIQMGVSRSQALHNMGRRSSVVDLRNFVFAVTQAEQYGLPIADTLRIQAAELRDKRRQRAEEKAVKIPVKITFPLVLCIFPALFVVLLGPAALSIWRGFL